MKRKGEFTTTLAMLAPCQHTLLEASSPLLAASLSLLLPLLSWSFSSLSSIFLPSCLHFAPSSPPLLFPSSSLPFFNRLVLLKRNLSPSQVLSPSPTRLSSLFFVFSFLKTSPSSSLVFFRASPPSYPPVFTSPIPLPPCTSLFVSCPAFSSCLSCPPFAARERKILFHSAYVCPQGSYPLIFKIFFHVYL